MSDNTYLFVLLHHKNPILSRHVSSITDVAKQSNKCLNN